MKPIRVLRLFVHAVLAVGAAVYPVARTAPDQTVFLGTVRLDPGSGSVDTTPVFASGVTSASCPAGYGSDALLRIGRPGGPYTNLARPLTSGGYDRAAVTATPNRSFMTALGGTAPQAGEWWVVAECFSQTQGQHPGRFVTSITVAGSGWRLSPGGGTAAAAATANPAGAASPSAGPQPSAPDVVPEAGPGTEAAPGAPTPLPVARTGSASLGVSLWWLAGVVGVLALVGVGWLATRPAAAAARTGGANHPRSRSGGHP
ncbi:hypothetical protein [Polymorphospora lycopeni]|uniref:Uncharacterized protein n=1 Tax=Polymorphospora lycopeni TaxID=3140240 RepID=A0ABV5CUS9_9ACTN